jgi:formylglycine-generating enzyme required for sulfatase activity
MIKNSLLLVLVGLSLSFSVQRTKKFIPPGTVQISETFFADETEVSNLSWLEYEHWTAVKYGFGSKEHQAVLPDTLVWRNAESYNEPYVKYYYRHPGYHNFPVVGVNYEQALIFCKWRTERVKEYYALIHKKELVIEYTLPNKEEWELISMSSSSVLNNKGRDEKGLATLNCARELEDSLLKDKRINNGKFPDVTTPVYAYKPNRFGLFNSLGNVSEMVLEKGLSKGGGWRHPLEQCRVGKEILYTKTEAWLGFRCVCILKQAS